MRTSYPLAPVALPVLDERSEDEILGYVTS